MSDIKGLQTKRCSEPVGFSNLRIWMVCAISLLLLLLFLLPWLLTSAMVRPIAPPRTDAAGMSLSVIPTITIFVLPTPTSAP